MNQLELVVEDLPRVQLEAPVNQVLLIHLLDSMAGTRPIITIIKETLNAKQQFKTQIMMLLVMQLATTHRQADHHHHRTHTARIQAIRAGCSGCHASGSSHVHSCLSVFSSNTMHVE
jgi:hypothetical protein